MGAASAVIDEGKAALQLAADQRSAIRKKALKGFMKLTPEASKKAAELELEGRQSFIFPFLIALFPAVLHDGLDILGDVLLGLFAVAGVPLAMAAGGAAGVAGVAAAIANVLTTFLLPLLTPIIGATFAGVGMIAIGFIFWLGAKLIGWVLTGMIFILTAGRVDSKFAHVGFGVSIVKLLYMLALGSDNWPAIGWLPMSTLSVIALMGIMILSQFADSAQSAGGTSASQESEAT